MEIELSKGVKAIVDAEDGEIVANYRWYFHSSGYAGSSQGGRANRQTLLMHRLILQQHGVDLSGMCVDHINRNKLDNRKENLRVCSVAQNSQHRVKASHNQSGFKGVDWVKKDQRWRAKIRVNGTVHTLGYFDNPVDAARAYNAGAILYHGEFAVLNSIPENMKTLSSTEEVE